jgi:3-deoxy-D-manno-octulosonate 8-phosphate phosphatase KdsC-like HAD superfamily phosphatase
VAAYVTEAPGGHGAAREAVEVLLKARGEWNAILDRYFVEQTAHAV